mgnify:CR=1 FL=1
MELLSNKIEDRIYTAQEALTIVKENANAKFDETIEAHIRLGIDPKYPINSFELQLPCQMGQDKPLRLQ